MTAERYTIQQIEQALNYWRDAEGPHDGVSLGKQASKLAAVYGSMIIEHSDNIVVAAMDDEVAQAIDFALRQQPLAL